MFGFDIIKVSDAMEVAGIVIPIVWASALIVGNLRTLKEGQEALARTQAQLGSRLDTALTAIGTMAARVARIEGYCDGRDHTGMATTDQHSLNLGTGD